MRSGRVRWRLAPVAWWVSHRLMSWRRAWWRFALWWKNRRPSGPLRLHVGCGGRGLDGWFNVDLEPQPGVDLVVDVRKGMPFQGVDRVFAEHFLEHLTADEGLSFLGEVHRVLDPGGRVRLTTPNLDWVVSTHTDALATNRAFYGWGHRFIWDRELLQEALESAGFTDVRWYRYGESDDSAFAGLEGHDRAEDAAEQEHVLVVEATRGEEDPSRRDALQGRIERELLLHATSDYSARYWRKRWCEIWWRGGSRPGA